MGCFGLSLSVYGCSRINRELQTFASVVFADVGVGCEP
ncbi:MAG: hypothetical protein QG574_4871 [Cyanobacteriota bacterium erpe_2018_sw_21hr_WHONDRS-SW48-000092_B_bin.40]|nr:hypothetical protein [Cyanobacteriota bacterium erpe_2018_sw_21hr_WHONDRS-SW48-000092_B_bin.40]